MEIINLYRYVRPDGGTDISPVKPEGDYEILYRIIAAEGKVVSRDNLNFYGVIDTESAEGWLEYDNPEADERNATNEDYEAALAKLGVE